ncbi:hypothetical protein [Desulfotignum phosphitoxidans]|uniref:Uncharacterized protein n=1 Tax=Desulfotignum phosphitoxidans DSM 13687 TaxID=1286635 RepID=S0FWT7_9BACT|nr:hypothetical protein [Desulfotignum phosphitoxidans]EMS79175.1 hypothetical protein Dpo_5c00980 [Desulfotignum phosphitoxidans DSM 13687]
MNISRIEILKQPNGKYAAYDVEEECFELTNFETPEDIKAFFLDRVDGILSEQIHYAARSADRFNMYAELYKIKHGLVDDEKEDARATLLEMGVSVEGS